MDYDPVKDRLGNWLAGPRRLPMLFKLLDVLFLRSWYVRKTLSRLGLGPESRVLDAGTGFGQYAWYIVRKYPGTTVLGTDIKEDYLTRAQQCFEVHKLADRITLLVDDITDTQVTGAFNAVLAVDILEHILEDEEALRQLARLTTPGGHIIISTPSDLGGSDVESESDDSFIGEHVRDGYNKTDLTQKLIRAGYSNVDARYSYGPWGSLAWRLLIKHPIRLLGHSMIWAPLVGLYYILVLPIGLLLNLIDLHHDNTTGTGLIVVAEKPA